MPVENQICGQRDPFSSILTARFLAVPELRLRHPDGGIGKPVLVEINSAHPTLLCVAPHFGKGLVPIDVGVVYQQVCGAAQTEALRYGM